MIGLEISGGLGNQFFRYAYARTLFEQRKNKGKYDVFSINYKNVDGHGFAGSLCDFQILEHKASYSSRLFLKYGSWLQIMFFAVFKFLSILLKNERFANLRQKVLGRMGIMVSEYPDKESRISCPMSNNVFVYGSFEHIKYFEDMKEILCKEFIPKYPELEENMELYKIIRSENSVCLAIRRGDFMSAENRKIFYVCDLIYFQRAVDYMRSHVKNPVFIVFSNDIDWVKQNLHIDGKVYYESGKDPVWETFRLMYSCKHFIISNSTLHWWAQYKGEAKDKIVIAPDRWYNAKGWTEHLMLDYFVRIHTDVPYMV
ncbi:MAG: alpha-1,2-fucosyltransferase [Prevotella sp.]